MTQKFTLKKDGRYYTAMSTGEGWKVGFFAHGIGACYSYDLPTVKSLQTMVGGVIVEVVHAGGFSYTEKEVS